MKRLKPLLFLLWCTACSHQQATQEIKTKSTRFQSFEKAFYALADKELKQNKAATKPDLKILKITEAPNILKIKYVLKYNETFSDGEFIQRETRGTAVLKKNLASSEEEWVLDGLEDAKQSLIFKKGSKFGT
ncbi:MAG: hypothetical protein R3A80_00525 [Bdellovibrionota bacterium]